MWRIVRDVFSDAHRSSSIAYCVGRVDMEFVFPFLTAFCMCVYPAQSDTMATRYAMCNVYLLIIDVYLFWTSADSRSFRLCMWIFHEITNTRRNLCMLSWRSYIEIRLLKCLKNVDNRHWWAILCLAGFDRSPKQQGPEYPSNFMSFSFNCYEKNKTNVYGAAQTQQFKIERTIWADRHIVLYDRNAPPFTMCVTVIKKKRRISYAIQ